MSFYNTSNTPNFRVGKGLNPNGIQDQYKVTQQVPAGTISQFAGEVCPEGYKFCDGSALSRKLFNALFYAIGTTYGIGDGVTTFNLPDLRSKVPVGLSNSQPEFNSLNNQGGEINHTLTTSEMPSHNHSGTTDLAGAHSHTSNAVGGQGNYGLCIANGANTAVNVDASSGELNLWTTPGALAINSNGNHTHTFTT